MKDSSTGRNFDSPHWEALFEGLSKAFDELRATNVTLSEQLRVQSQFLAQISSRVGKLEQLNGESGGISARIRQTEEANAQTAKAVQEVLGQLRRFYGR